jgi:hypothetical protein
LGFDNNPAAAGRGRDPSRTMGVTIIGPAPNICLKLLLLQIRIEFERLVIVNQGAEKVTFVLLGGSTIVIGSSKVCI